MKRSILTALALALTIAWSGVGVSAQEMRSYTDDAGRTVQVPVHPTRIVTLHDSSLTVPLIELGVMPVGAFGREGADGTSYMRGAATLTGVTFENSDIVNVGGSPADLEKIAALEPDLILTATFQKTPIDQLEKIAPTVVVEDNMRGELATFEDIAQLTGTQNQLERLKQRYANQIAQIRDVLGDKEVSASILLTQGDQIAAWHTYGVIGKVLRDAGFTFPDVLNEIEGSDRAFYSGEALQSFDADFVFVTYDTPRGVTPEVAREQLEAIAPNYCKFLQACMNNQMIFLPREDAVARSYTALGMMAATVLSNVGGRDFVTIQGDN